MVKFPTMEALSIKELKELSYKDHNKYHKKLASVWRKQITITAHTYDPAEFKKYKVLTDKTNEELSASFKIMKEKKDYKPVGGASFKKHWVISWLDWDYKTHKTISLKNPNDYGKKAIPSGVRGKVREIINYHYE